MPRKVFKVRGAVVGVDTTALDRAVERFAREGVDAAAEIVEEATRAQHEIAFREWGVDTGDGRKSLQTVAVREGTAYAVRIFSRHGPVRHQSFDGKRPTFWTVLVVRPLRRIRKRLAKMTAKAMAAAAEGR